MIVITVCSEIFFRGVSFYTEECVQTDVSVHHLNYVLLVLFFFLFLFSNFQRLAESVSLSEFK